MYSARGRQLATNVISRKKKPPGRHVDPGGINDHGLLLPYGMKKKRVQPQAKNMRHVVQRGHHAFNTMKNPIPGIIHRNMQWVALWGQSVDIHVSYAHAPPGILHETAMQLGFRLTGKFRPCGGCSMSKGKRQPLRKTTLTRSERPSKRVSVDLAWPKPTQSVGGALCMCSSRTTSRVLAGRIHKAEVRCQCNTPVVPKRYSCQHEANSGRVRPI